MTRDVQFHKSAALLALLGAPFFALSHAVCADDLNLKDGTTISGTIVGFEDNSFKVKTTYGFAVVLKEQVASINMAEAPNAAAKKKSDALVPASAPPDAAASPSLAFVAAKPVAPAVHYAVPAAPVLAGLALSKPPVLMAGSEPTEPEPPPAAPIRESVSGTTYTNETYRFQMYKPPGWQVIAGARAVLPGAVAAMGTGDETTYLLIGRDAAGKSLAADMDAAERRLREAMENYRPLGEQRVTVSGAAATERRFRGSADHHDWSGVVAFIPHGSQLYTVFGMTRADNDLVQIEENVISRAIASLEFLP